MENQALIRQSNISVGELSRPLDKVALAENYLAAANSGWLEDLCTMIEKHGSQDINGYRWEFQRDGFNFRFSSNFERKLNGFISRAGREIHALSDTNELPHYIDGQWPEVVRREHAELEIKLQAQRAIEARKNNVKLMLDTNAGI